MLSIKTCYFLLSPRRQLCANFVIFFFELAFDYAIWQAWWQIINILTSETIDFFGQFFHRPFCKVRFMISIFCGNMKIENKCVKAFLSQKKIRERLMSGNRKMILSWNRSGKKKLFIISLWVRQFLKFKLKKKSDSYTFLNTTPSQLEICHLGEHFENLNLS